MNEDFKKDGISPENEDTRKESVNEVSTPAEAPDFKDETKTAPEAETPAAADEQRNEAPKAAQEPEAEKIEKVRTEKVSGQNGYAWNTAPQKAPKKKHVSGGRVLLRSILVILLAALVVLASFGIVHIAQRVVANKTDKKLSQPPESSSVEHKKGFELENRTEAEEHEVKDIAAAIRPAVVGVVNYRMNSLTASGYGSGVIINKDGYIVTNYHVIKGADRVKLVLYDEKEALADIIGYDEQTDLAVLRVIENEKVHYSDLTFAKFGNSDELQLAETVIAIGNPGGLEFAGTVTRGIVSGLNIKTGLSGNVKLIQTDAAINPGNSGGPLIDLYGNVIGITSQKIVDTQYEGMGFAIPSNTVKPTVDSIIIYGYVPGRPMLGITGSDIDEYVAYFNKVPQGVLIASIDPDSDIASKGVRKSDIITSFNGVTIKTMDELNTEKEKCAAGDTVELGIYRYSNGNTFTVKVVLSENKPH